MILNILAVAVAMALLPTLAIGSSGVQYVGVSFGRNVFSCSSVPNADYCDDFSSDSIAAGDWSNVSSDFSIADDVLTLAASVSPGEQTMRHTPGSVDAVTLENNNCQFFSLVAIDNDSAPGFVMRSSTSTFSSSDRVDFLIAEDFEPQALHVRTSGTGGGLEDAITPFLPSINKNIWIGACIEGSGASTTISVYDFGSNIPGTDKDTFGQFLVGVLELDGSPSVTNSPTYAGIRNWSDGQILSTDVRVEAWYAFNTQVIATPAMVTGITTANRSAEVSVVPADYLFSVLNGGSGSFDWSAAVFGTPSDCDDGAPTVTDWVSVKTPTSGTTLIAGSPDTITLEFLTGDTCDIGVHTAVVRVTGSNGSPTEVVPLTIDISVNLTVTAASGGDGANIYIVDGGTGNQSGDDWSNAMASLPTIQPSNRGDTFWISDGSYGSIIIEVGDSGSTEWIFFKKAIESSHGPATGWNSSYGDGVAVFSRIRIYSDYIHIDGQVGGGFGSWDSGHGFKVTNTAGRLIETGPASGPYNHVTIEHTEVVHTVWNSPAMDGVYLYKVDDTILRNMWIHEIGRNPYYVTGGAFNGSARHLLEQSFIARSTSRIDPEHGELVALFNNVTDAKIVNNQFADWRSTGGIIYWGGNDDTIFCGNTIFVEQQGFGTSSIAGWTSGQSGTPDSNLGPPFDVIVFNNTVYGINFKSAGGMFQAGGYGAGVSIYNNIYDTIETPEFNPGTFPGRFRMLGDRVDFNYFRDTPNNSNEATIWHDESDETNGQGDHGSGAIMTDASNFDFTIVRATDDGITSSEADVLQPGGSVNLGSVCDVDAAGNTRGADGTWDRGAYEYVE